MNSDFNVSSQDVLGALFALSLTLFSIWWAYRFARGVKERRDQQARRELEEMHRKRREQLSNREPTDPRFPS